MGWRSDLTDDTKKKVGLVKQMYLSENQVYPVSQICKELNISKKTLYRCLEFSGVNLRGGLDV